MFGFYGETDLTSKCAEIQIWSNILDRFILVITHYDRYVILHTESNCHQDLSKSAPPSLPLTNTLQLG